MVENETAPFDVPPEDLEKASSVLLAVAYNFHSAEAGNEVSHLLIEARNVLRGVLDMTRAKAIVNDALEDDEPVQ